MGEVRPALTRSAADVSHTHIGEVKPALTRSVGDLFRFRGRGEEETGILGGP
jgi:hypothetical protein